MDEKREAPEVQAQSKLLRWLDNFWYHYKWHTIVVAFFLFVGIFSLSQCASEENADLTVAFAGNRMDLGGSSLQAFGDVISGALPEDYDGNGTKHIALAQFAVFSEEELTELYTFHDETDGQDKVDISGLSGAKHYNTERIQTLQTYIMTGDCAVWFVSPYVYETMFEGLVQITDRAVLGETAFYRYYDAFAENIPPETMIVVTKPIMGYMSKPENHQLARDYFQAIVGFTAP